MEAEGALVELEAEGAVVELEAEGALVELEAEGALVELEAEVTGRGALVDGSDVTSMMAPRFFCFFVFSLPLFGFWSSVMSG